MTEQEAVDLVSANGWGIADVPQDVQTDQVCIAAIRNDWQVFFNSIGPARRTKPVCAVAVSINHRALAYVPDAQIDQEMCFAAVNQSAMALQWVPPRFRSQQLCNLAIAKDAWAIEYVPQENQSAEICKAFTQMQDFDLSRITEHSRSSELCLAAVTEDFSRRVIFRQLDAPESTAAERRKWHLSFDYVPEHYKTVSMCRKAVLTAPHLIEKTPIESRTPDTCKYAVTEEGQLLGQVPEEYRTPELCKIAVENDWWAIRYVPRQYQTTDLCLDIFEMNGVPFASLPDVLKTSALCLSAVMRDHKQMKYVPDNAKTVDIALIAVKGDFTNYKYIPRDVQSEKVWMAAAIQDGFTLEVVPERFKSQDVCFESLTRNKDAYDFIPDQIKTSDLFRNRISEFYSNLIEQSEWGQYALRSVHPDFITYELYLKAIRVDPYTIREVIRPDYHTPELCCASFHEPYDTDEMLDDCPKMLFTPNLCAAAAKYGTNYNFMCIPDELITHDLCKSFVSRDGLNLEDIPDRHRNVEICQIAVDNHPRAMDFVPEDIRGRIVVTSDC